MDLQYDATHVSVLDDPQLRVTTITDIDQLLSLCRSVAATPNCGLARHAEEIGPDYVGALPSYRNARGISIVALLGDAPAGEIHTAPSPPRQVRLVPTDLTVAVYPQGQGRGGGSRQFAALFETTARLTSPDTRIEPVARTGNGAAIRLYERLGCRA
jgi:GNAT superfamily N-acetyltransferase